MITLTIALLALAQFLVELQPRSYTPIFRGTFAMRKGLWRIILLEEFVECLKRLGIASDVAVDWLGARVAQQASYLSYREPGRDNRCYGELRP